MRIFGGHNNTLTGSLARFKCDKFDEVVRVLAFAGYRKSDYGRAEFDCKLTYCGRGGWLMIIRKTGEPMWNIVRLGGHIEESIDDTELDRLVGLIRAAGIVINLPEKYLEYIPPIEKVDPADVPTEFLDRHAVSGTTIEEAQEMEKEWNEKRLKMTPEELAVKNLY